MLFLGWEVFSFFWLLVLFKFEDVVMVGCEIKFFEFLMVGSFGCEKVILLIGLDILIIFL